VIGLHKVLIVASGLVSIDIEPIIAFASKAMKCAFGACGRLIKKAAFWIARLFVPGSKSESDDVDCFKTESEKWLQISFCSFFLWELKIKNRKRLQPQPVRKQMAVTSGIHGFLPTAKRNKNNVQPKNIHNKTR
jgi:hypothetical protein